MMETWIFFLFCKGMIADTDQIGRHVGTVAFAKSTNSFSH